MSEFSRELFSFVEIARCKSIREAAERLNVASSALSRQMRLLESDLGVQLLTRNVRGVELTVQGRMLLKQAETWFEDRNRLRAKLSGIADLENDHTRVGAMECFSRTLAPDLFESINNGGSAIRMDVKIGDTDALLNDLKNDVLDLVIAFNAQQNRHIRIHSTFPCRIGLVYSTNEWNLNQKEISVGGCLGWPLCLPGESLSLHTRLYAELLKQRVKLDIVVTSSSIGFLRELVLSGKAVSFLTWFHVYDEVLAGRLGFIPLAEKRLSETSCLCIPHNARLSKVQDMVLDECRRLIAAILDTRQDLESRLEDQR